MELTIEKIQECKKVKELLDEVCPRYFEDHAYEWEIYNDWKFSDDHPEYIVISYAYFDWNVSSADATQGGISAQKIYNNVIKREYI